MPLVADSRQSLSGQKTCRDTHIVKDFVLSQMLLCLSLRTEIFLNSYYGYYKAEKRRTVS